MRNITHFVHLRIAQYEESITFVFFYQEYFALFSVFRSNFKAVHVMCSSLAILSPPGIIAMSALVTVFILIVAIR